MGRHSIGRNATVKERTVPFGSRGQYSREEQTKEAARRYFLKMVREVCPEVLDGELCAVPRGTERAESTPASSRMRSSARKPADRAPTDTRGGGWGAACRGTFVPHSAPFRLPLAKAGLVVRVPEIASTA